MDTTNASTAVALALAGKRVLVVVARAQQISSTFATLRDEVPPDAVLRGVRAARGHHEIAFANRGAILILSAAARLTILGRCFDKVFVDTATLRDRHQAALMGDLTAATRVSFEPRPIVEFAH